MWSWCWVVVGLRSSSVVEVAGANISQRVSKLDIYSLLHTVAIFPQQKIIWGEAVTVVAEQIGFKIELPLDFLDDIEAETEQFCEQFIKDNGKIHICEQIETHIYGVDKQVEKIALVSFVFQS